MNSPRFLRQALRLLIGAVALGVSMIFSIRMQPVSAQSDGSIARAYQEKRWSFDVQDGIIRFSHGNHARRDRWFRAYFGKGYGDCASTCHNIDLPEPREGQKVDFVAEIRKQEKATHPFGIQEATCRTCHNNVTAPNECQWCHASGSKPLEGIQTAAMAKYEQEVDKRIADYNEAFQPGVDTVRDYKEKSWFFDIQNNNIRFSHGNHKSRDRIFKAYFGTGYEDCGNCHNLGLLSVGQDGPIVENGDHLNTVEDIRDAKNEIFPFGIMMARCFSACHNALTAPNDCTNCHLPGSRPLSGGQLSDDVAVVVRTTASRAGLPGGANDPGQKVFAERRCILCHRVNKVGTPVTSDLSDIGDRHDVTWLTQFLTNHQEPEPKTTTPRLRLSSVETQSLARYLTTLRKSP